MSEKLDLTQKLLCNKVGKVFELAAERLPCYELTFCEVWLRSELCRQLHELEETLICQSRNYLYNSIMQTAELPVHTGHEMNSGAMYWLGYLLTYLMFSEGISGKSTLKKFDLKEILEQYDVLHTMSVRAAIKTILKDYTIEAVMLDAALNSELSQ